MSFKTWLFAACMSLPAVACAVPSEDAPVGEQDDLTGSHTFACSVDTPRLGKYDDQHFASLTLTVSKKKVKISKVVFTESFTQGLEQEIANRQDQLAKGLDSDGVSPLSAADKKDIAASIARVQKILAAGKAHALVFTGKNQPYTKKPKVPTVQYPLEVAGGGVDADTLWGELGNEGFGARALIRPEMLDGDAAHPDIEWEGNQGPMWDRFDCK